MDNEMNAFDEGVAPGGLRNKAQIKLLVEFLVDSLKEPINAAMTVEALVTHDLANYFEAVQAVDELVDNRSLATDDEGFLSVTPMGKDSLRELIGELPFSVREIALADAAMIQMKARRGGENIARIEKTENGYNVICKVIHKEKSLLELTLYAAEYDQAESIRDKFIEDPAKVYSAIISVLYN